MIFGCFFLLENYIVGICIKIFKNGIDFISMLMYKELLLFKNKVQIYLVIVEEDNEDCNG